MRALPSKFKGRASQARSPSSLAPPRDGRIAFRPAPDRGATLPDATTMLRSLLTLSTTLALSATALHAQTAPLRAAPSGRATSEVTLIPAQGQPAAGAPATVIRVDYGQPHLRGRALHTDSLVPYDQPWRTGANAPTTLRTDVPLTLGGAAIAPGTYVLFTLPTRAGWKLIVQRSADPTVATPYDAANDVARVDLRRRPLATPLESLTMWLVPSNQPGAARGELRLAWGAEELSVDWSVR